MSPLVSSLFYSSRHIKGERAQEQYTFRGSVTLVEEFEGAEMIPCGSVDDGPAEISPSSISVKLTKSSPKLSLLSLNDVGATEKKYRFSLFVKTS